MSIRTSWVAPFKVIIYVSNLHHIKKQQQQLGCETVAGNFEVSAQNCLTSTRLNSIIIKIRKISNGGKSCCFDSIAFMESNPSQITNFCYTFVAIVKSFRMHVHRDVCQTPDDHIYRVRYMGSWHFFLPTHGITPKMMLLVSWLMYKRSSKLGKRADIKFNIDYF